MIQAVCVYAAFAKPQARALYEVVDRPAAVLNALFRPAPKPVDGKWL